MPQILKDDFRKLHLFTLCLSLFYTKRDQLREKGKKILFRVLAWTSRLCFDSSLPEDAEVTVHHFQMSSGKNHKSI